MNSPAAGEVKRPPVTSGSKLLIPAIALLAFAVAGCGDTEVGRIPFSDVGKGNTEVTIDSGKKVQFWTHLDLVDEADESLARAVIAEDDVSLVYSIVLYHDGEMVAKVTCDALDVSEFDVRTKINPPGISFRTARSFRYLGKMKCSTRVPNFGTTTVEAILEPVNPKDGSSVEMPKTYTLTRADLVIKQ